MRLLTICLLFCSFSLFSQVEVNKAKPIHPEKSVKSPSDFGRIESLQLIKGKPVPRFRRHREVPNKLRRYAYTNLDAKPIKEDPVVQFGHKRSSALSPLQAWDGMNEASQGVSPPDPSGAVGLNHYVQMVNVAMQVFDKQGNSLWGPTDLSSVFPGSANDGDPIVLYDQFADRWLISQFQNSGNKMLIAISQSNDPLGAWFYYDYAFTEFPDYPKFSIWGDGYYMTANMGVQNAVCFEREKMLAGDPSARMVALTFPNLEDNGFFSALPAHASGDVLPTGPIDLFYFQDDGWAGGKDRIKIWEMTVDWNDPLKSNIIEKQEIEVAPFNAEFDQNWNDLSQPGTAQKLDAVPGAFMYMGHYRAFKKYNSITLCHTVDVDLTTARKAGVRWYELREQEGEWSLFQESTYAPDGDSRWLGSIAQDRQGNIGMAYSVTSSTTFPSIRFTGRKSTDALNQMTISESSAFTGTGVQTGSTRFGDYAHMTLDPSDGLSFWYTGEYISDKGWETGVFSFKVGEAYDFDVAVLDIIDPNGDDLTASEKITVLLKNTGTTASGSFPIHYSLDGNIVNEVFSGSIAPGDTSYFTFGTNADLSVQGDHDLVTYTDHVQDGDRLNDSLCKKLSTAFNLDVGVLQIISPLSGVGLASESIVLKLKNFGVQTISEIPIVVELDGVAFLDTLKQGLEFGEVIEFTTTKSFDFSAVKTFELIVYSKLNHDQKLINDTAKISIINKNCNPVSDCEFTDKLTLVKVGDIENVSDCSSNGYGDFTNIETDLVRDKLYEFIVTTEEDDHRLSVWVDFNDNQIFENSELIITDSIYSRDGNFDFIIPANATVGKHLMRVRTNWENSSADPCVEYDYGETEDYTVNIIIPDNMNLVDEIKFSIIGGSESIRLASNFDLTQSGSLEIMNGVGQLIYREDIKSGIKLDKVISVSTFAAGLYYVKLSNGENKSVQQFVVR